MHNTKKVGGGKSKNRSASKNGPAPKSKSLEKVMTQSEKKAWKEFNNLHNPESNGELFNENGAAERRRIKENRSRGARNILCN
jgi:hypothetical protein